MIVFREKIKSSQSTNLVNKKHSERQILYPQLVDEHSKPVRNFRNRKAQLTMHTI